MELSPALLSWTPSRWSPQPIVPPARGPPSPLSPQRMVPPAHRPSSPWSPQPVVPPARGPRLGLLPAGPPRQLWTLRTPFPRSQPRVPPPWSGFSKCVLVSEGYSFCKPFLRREPLSVLYKPCWAPAPPAPMLGSLSGRAPPLATLEGAGPRAQPEAPPWSPLWAGGSVRLDLSPKGLREGAGLTGSRARSGPCCPWALPASRVFCTPGAPKGKPRQEAVGPLGPSRAPLPSPPSPGPLWLPSPTWTELWAAVPWGAVPGVLETLGPHKERVGEPVPHPSGQA